MVSLLLSLGEDDINDDLVGIDLNLRRKACILARTPMDHSFDAVVVEDTNFDIENTIFSNIRDPIVRQAISRTIGVKLHWLEQSSVLITKRYLSDIIRPIQDNRIMDFLRNECDMKMEMCDDTFEEHLVFCHNYCVANFSSHSPRVMLFHGVLGENTNHFPMSMEKYPQLMDILSPDELAHVDAFPSMSRLLLNYTLLSALRQGITDGAVLKKVNFHRVIDNQVISLDAEQLWVHLNYHLIHFMDFVPSTDWYNSVSHENFRLFLHLYQFLKDFEKLYVTIAEVNCGIGPRGEKITLQEMISLSAWQNAATCKMVQDSVRRYSEQIRHSLKFELHFFNKDEMCMVTDSTPSQFTPSQPPSQLENLADLRFVHDESALDSESFQSLPTESDLFRHLQQQEFFHEVDVDPDRDKDKFDQDVPDILQSPQNCTLIVNEEYHALSPSSPWSPQNNGICLNFSPQPDLSPTDVPRHPGQWHDEEVGLDRMTL